MPAGGLVTVGVVGAIAGPVIGGIIGAQNSAGDRAAAQAATQAAFQEINQIGAPPDLSRQIILKHLQQAGLYTPQLEQQINAQFAKVTNTPQGTAAMDTAVGGLNLLKQRAEQGGLNATDRANLNQVRQQAAIDSQGKLEAIRQNMAARGMAGSGSELAQELGAASSSGADESASADRIASQAQQAALSAAMQSGQLGSQINSQLFGQQATNTDIQNREQQFNTANSIARQQRNVASQNQGQMYNLSEAQRLSDQNTTMDNAELARENAAKRQYWQDQAGLAGMKAGARLGQAQQLQSQADATAKTWQGVGSGIGAASGAALKYAAATANKTPTNQDTTSGGGDYYSPSLSSQYGSPASTTNATDYLKEHPDAMDTSGGYAYGGEVHMKNGGVVPGHEIVPGDSPLNDIIKAKLSPGEVVLPKEVVDKGPDAAYGYLHALLNHARK